MKIKDDDVYYPVSAARDRFRRIICVLNNNVFYSNGGHKNYSCKKLSFQRWIKRNEALEYEAYKRSAKSDPTVK